MTDLPPPSPPTPVIDPVAPSPQVSWWKRKVIGIPTWVIVAVGAFIAIGAIGSATKKDDDNATKDLATTETTHDSAADSTPPTAPDETDPPTTTAPAPTTIEQATTTTINPVIPDGVYIVGSEIQPGTYRVGQYYARQDANQEIIANDITFECPTIMIVEPTDVYIEITGGALRIEDSLPYNPIEHNCTDGRFLVGFDIQPGQYKVLPTSSGSYWARWDDQLDIIDNDLSDGQTIVVIKDTDFAISISGTLQAV